MAERVNLPYGFRFCPSDEELITGYLKPKILGQKLVCDVINDIELYGPNSTPWQLFDVNDDSWTSSHENFTEKYLYVFTTLSKVSESPKQKQKRIRQNTCKTADCGTWVGKTKKKTIKDRMGNVIGHQRMLLFAIKYTGPQFDLSKAGHFRMHEFTLGGINRGLKSAVGDIVLCKITFDSSKDPICKDQNMELNNNKEKVVRIVGNNLEETRNETLTSVVEMNSTAGDNLADTSESLFVMDSGNGNSYNSLAAVTEQYDNGSQDFGWDPSFTDWFMGLLTSDQEQGAFEDINKLGKRKFEEENLYSSKKICL